MSTDFTLYTHHTCVHILHSVHILYTVYYLHIPVPNTLQCTHYKIHTRTNLGKMPCNVSLAKATTLLARASSLRWLLESLTMANDSGEYSSPVDIPTATVQSCVIFWSLCITCNNNHESIVVFQFCCFDRFVMWYAWVT